MNGVPKLPVCFVANDQRPDLVATLQGTDLTNHTVTLHMKRPDDSVLVKSATEVDYNAKFSTFKFTWDAGDLIAGVNQECEIQFVDPASKPLTSRLFLIDVRDELA